MNENLIPFELDERFIEEAGVESVTGGTIEKMGPTERETEMD